MGDHLALTNLLTFFDEDERLVETGISGIDHRFDTVVKVDGFPLLGSDRQGDSVTVIGLAFIKYTIKHLALLKGLIDLSDVTIGDGIDGWITSWLARIHSLGRRLEVDVGSRVGLGGPSALVGMTGPDVAPIDQELGARFRSKLANVGERFGCCGAATEQAGQQDQRDSRRWLGEDLHDQFKKQRFDSRPVGVVGGPVGLPFERLALSQ